MTEFYMGVASGAGWGLFVGAFLGAFFFWKILGEGDDDESGGDK